MTPFDQTTEKKGEEYGGSVRKRLVERMPPHFVTGELPKWDGSADFATSAAFTAGRNSAKDSLAILARGMESVKRRLEKHPEALDALKSYEADGFTGTNRTTILIVTIDEIIAAVKERGDWPLEDR